MDNPTVDSHLQQDDYQQIVTCGRASGDTSLLLSSRAFMAALLVLP
jgi:hypothetical protein